MNLLYLFMLVLLFVVIYCVYLLTSMDYLIVMDQTEFATTSSHGLGQNTFTITMDIKTNIRCCVLTMTDGSYRLFNLDTNDAGNVVLDGYGIPGNKTLTSPISVFDNKFHSIIIEYKPNYASLTVDGTTRYSSSIKKQSINITEVFIGGFDALRRHYMFKGVIRNLTFGNVLKRDLQFVKSKP